MARRVRPSGGGIYRCWRERPRPARAEEARVDRVAEEARVAEEPRSAPERTRPGGRPRARWTARTVPLFFSMTPTSMHSSTLHILCICGGCTSECQKGSTSARARARHTAHTVSGGSSFHLDRASEVRRQSRPSQHLVQLADRENSLTDSCWCCCYSNCNQPRPACLPPPT